MNIRKKVGTLMIERWWITRVTQPLATAAFFGGAWLAYLNFPKEFDWRFVVVSALESPRDNPNGYHLFAIGLALSGVALLPFRSYMGHVLAPFAPKGARAVRGLLAFGIGGMLLVALFAHRPALYPRLHENLALLSYSSLVFALLTATLLLMRHPDATVLAASHTRRWIMPLLGILIFGPLFATALSQLLVYTFPAVVLDGATPDSTLPPWLNLAFWEWIVSVLLYASAWLLAWLAVPIATRGPAPLSSAALMKKRTSD